MTSYKVGNSSKTVIDVERKLFLTMVGRILSFFGKKRQKTHFFSSSPVENEPFSTGFELLFLNFDKKVMWAQENVRYTSETIMMLYMKKDTVRHLELTRACARSKIR